MPTSLLTQTEITLIRSWLQGVSMEVLQDYAGDDSAFAVVKKCRSKLVLKSRRMQTGWGDDWLDRKNPDISSRRLHALVNSKDIDPDINQPLCYWLEDDLLDKLQSLKLITVADWLNLYQSDWWALIPGLGVSHARIIEQQIGKLFPDSMLETRMPIVFETAIVPLTRFLLPEHLNGSNGSNRSPGTAFIPAKNDYEAIMSWLVRLEQGSHTLRSYQREAERLLLWTVLVKQKPLSSLNLVDMADYRQFLADPKPQELWIGAPQKKHHARWKPFTGPLSARSLKFSETVINGLFNFLVTQQYWLNNPLLALPKLKHAGSHQPMDTQRSFTESQWQLVNDFVNRQIEAHTDHAHLKWLRTRLVLQLGYSTGLRLHEIAQATLGDIVIRNRQGLDQYWLQVTGKGHRKREVPLPEALYLLITSTWQQLAGRLLSTAQDDYPVIPKLRGFTKNTLTPLAIHHILKQTFIMAANDLAGEHPETARKLEQASAHWLRHTHGSMAVERNIPLTMIRDNLGHSNIATTSHYVHADKDARYEAFVQGFSK